MSPQENRKRWLGLIALIPSLAMVFLDQTVLPVALPTIQQQLSASAIALQWTVNAYLLATAVLVLAAGKVCDRIGQRRAFVLGVSLFAIASALCGLSSTIFWLIAARTLQGIGAALLFPASTVLLMSLFPQSERGKASGINVGVSSLFLILGPLVGGYLTQEYSWNWIFWINIPLALLAIILVLLFIPPSPKGVGKIDFWGFLFFLISSTLFVLVIMQGREWGWTSLRITSFFFIALVAGFLLLLREKKAAHPFLELSLFKHPVFKAVNITVFAIQFILMITVFRAIFFQNYLGWSAEKTGFITFISCIPILFVSPVGGYLSDRYGPKLPIALGFLFLIFSFFWVGTFVEDPLFTLFFGLFAFSFGIPLVFTPSYASAMGSVPLKKAGIAFGTISTMRALGGTFGVAIIGSFIDNLEFRFFQSFTGMNESESMPLFAEGNPSIPPQLLPSLQEARLDAFFYSHYALAFLLIIAFAFVFVLHNRKSAHQLPSVPAEGWD